ncbi:hypothetical protein GOC74_09990 [Halomicrobium mukohataei]|uniref:PGF-CTERM sorting domain-containing protein n=1 Tax=Halomicrobium mukohataei TaxID=57705 RepID=A0A847UB32_9EURY|nr:hypothetical protein [Halomicrobium mukohataei]NLV10259.1 hypothetical protein [Halomicrobium mukohataei]
MDRRSLATLAVGVLLVLSGCADVAVDATVDGDGTVESYETTIEMPPSTYDRLQSTAEDEGYGSVERYLLRGVNESRAESVSYNQSLTDDGNVTVDLRLSSWNPGPSSGVETTVEEGNVTFVDRSFVQNSGQLGSQSGYALTYTVTMPTNVTDSNADTVEGATATWRYDSDEAIESPIRAQSPVPDSGSGPGVGVVGTLVAVALVVGLLARRT